MEEYKKDFDKWNKIKKELDKRVVNFTCYERQIWWCSIGLNIGSEEDGKNELFERPVLVIKKINNITFWVIPLTSKDHNGSYYFSLDSHNISRRAILSQVRLVSVKRFHRFVEKVSTYEFAIIKGKIGDLIKY